MGTEPPKKTGKERSRENLRPCKPGETANPRGSNRKQREQCVVKRLVNSGELDMEKIVLALEKHGLGGNVHALIHLLDRHQGKVPDKILHGGDVTIKVKRGTTWKP